MEMRRRLFTLLHEWLLNFNFLIFLFGVLDQSLFWDVDFFLYGLAVRSCSLGNLFSGRELFEVQAILFFLVRIFQNLGFQTADFIWMWIFNFRNLEHLAAALRIINFLRNFLLSLRIQKIRRFLITHCLIEREAIVIRISIFLTFFVIFYLWNFIHLL